MKPVPEKGGYSSGGRTVSELPPPPSSVTVQRQPSRLTMGEFRELTADVPDGWPILLEVRRGDNDFTFAETDASVDLVNREVVISDDTHVRR